MADLGHLRAPLAVHLRWVDGLCDEFYAQGDAARRLGMEVPDSMLREKAGPEQLARSQVGFFQVIVLPLLRAWAAATGTSRWLRRVEANHAHWADQSDGGGGGGGSRQGGEGEGEVEVEVEEIAGLPAQLVMETILEAEARSDDEDEPAGSCAGSQASNHFMGASTGRHSASSHTHLASPNRSLRAGSVFASIFALPSAQGGRAAAPGQPQGVRPLMNRVSATAAEQRAPSSAGRGGAGAHSRSLGYSGGTRRASMLVGGGGAGGGQPPTPAAGAPGRAIQFAAEST